MGREVLSERDYEYQEPGYLIDNQSWQEEIQKRLETLAAPPQALRILPVVEEPVFQELSEALEEPMEIKPPEPTAEEILSKAKIEAEETARVIEQGAKKNAFEIVEQARWEANDLLAKGKEEAEKEIQMLRETAQSEGRQEGIEKGRSEGLEAGKEEGKRSYDQVVSRWNGMLGKLVEERKTLLTDLKPVVVELTGEALRRCLKDEAAKHGQMVVEFVQEALHKAQDKVHLKLHLNPEDMREIEAQKERIGLAVGVQGMELIPDSRVELGGCRLETEAGSVDVQIPTVVEQVKKALESDPRW